MSSEDVLATEAAAISFGAPVCLPRVTIEFCTQCKWNLRAAYVSPRAQRGKICLGPSGCCTETIASVSSLIPGWASLPTTPRHGSLMALPRHRRTLPSHYFHPRTTTPLHAHIPTHYPRSNIQLTPSQFAQELLSTFGTSLGEVALLPSTGGTFLVTLFHRPPPPSLDAVSHAVLWDRKRDGGFPETKELKRRVRDLIQPGRDLGHVDRDYPTTVKDAAGGKDDVGGKEAELSSQTKHSCKLGAEGGCEDCA